MYPTPSPFRSRDPFSSPLISPFPRSYPASATATGTRRIPSRIFESSTPMDPERDQNQEQDDEIVPVRLEDKYAAKGSGSSNSNSSNSNSGRRSSTASVGGIGSGVEMNGRRKSGARSTEPIALARKLGIDARKLHLMKASFLTDSMPDVEEEREENGVDQRETDQDGDIDLDHGPPPPEPDASEETVAHSATSTALVLSDSGDQQGGWIEGNLFDSAAGAASALHELGIDEADALRQLQEHEERSAAFPFRAGWSSHGQFLQSDGKGGLIVQSLSCLDLEKNDFTYDYLLFSLDAHLSVEDESEHARIERLCHSHVNSLLQLRATYPKSNEIRYCLSVWRLVEALWITPEDQRDSGDAYLEAYKRRAALSCWLEETILEEVKGDRDDFFVTMKASAEKIFTLLCCHQIEDACEVAQQIRDYRLSLLIAQAGEDSQARQDLAKQITVWKASHLWDHIDPIHQDIYLLLSGDTTSIKFRGLSWLQCLGLRLWYGSAPGGEDFRTLRALVTQNVSIESAVKSYHNAVAEQLATPPTAPQRPRQQGARRSRFDIAPPKYNDARYDLIRLYLHSAASDTPTDLLPLFMPENAGKLSLDYTLSFFLFDALRSTSAREVIDSMTLKASVPEEKFDVDDEKDSQEVSTEGDGTVLHNIVMNLVHHLTLLNLYTHAIALIRHANQMNPSGGWDEEQIIREILYRFVRSSVGTVKVIPKRDELSLPLSLVSKSAIFLDATDVIFSPLNISKEFTLEGMEEVKEDDEKKTERRDLTSPSLPPSDPSASSSQHPFNPLDNDEFLIRNVKIPHQWVFLAKAQRARYEGLREVEASYLLKALTKGSSGSRLSSSGVSGSSKEHLLRLHHVLGSFLSPLYILQDKRLQLLEMLSQLEPHMAPYRETWRNGGEIYLRYLRLLQGNVSDPAVQEKIKELLIFLGSQPSMSGSSSGKERRVFADHSSDNDEDDADLLASVAQSEMSSQLNALLVDYTTHQSLLDAHKTAPTAASIPSFYRAMTEDCLIQHLHHVTDSILEG